MRRPALTLTALVFLCALVSVHAQTPKPVTSEDFARATSQQLTTELAAARVAQTKSQDPAVKDFASKLAADHEQAAQDLAKICQRLHIDLWPQPNPGQPVAGAPGETPAASFDGVYTMEVSQNLAKAETSFNEALRSPKVDPKLKDFARQQLQTTQRYRALAAPLARSHAGQGSH